MARRGTAAVAEPETEIAKPDETDELAGYYQDEAEDEESDELEVDGEADDEDEEADEGEDEESEEDEADESDEEEDDEESDEDEDELEGSVDAKPGEKTIEELQADYDADRPLRRADIQRLSQHHAAERQRQQEEQTRLATIQNAVPEAANAIVDAAAQRFGMDANQKDALKLIVDNTLLNGDTALREVVGAAILTPVVNLMAGQLLASGATAQEIQATEVKDFIALAAKAAERRLVASGEYVKKTAVGKAKAEGRAEGRSAFEQANPERAAVRPGRGDRSARPKSYEQLEAGFGEGKNSAAEDREYMRLKAEREGR